MTDGRRSGPPGHDVVQAADSGQAQRHRCPAPLRTADPGGSGYLRDAATDLLTTAVRQDNGRMLAIVGTLVATASGIMLTLLRK